jgi:glycosyltransferase involved in cell wall biosynthesis
MNIGVLIPAYNPEQPLIRLVESLLRFDFRQVVVVNDGSDPSCKEIFDQLDSMANCRVVHHAVNLGKGRSLKTGFNYCYLNFPNLQGIVTADADGQHLAEDIKKVVDTFLKNPGSLVIGARNFAQGTPLRSLLGNTITRYVFRLFAGGNLTDTQSGLRCIPMAMVPDLIRLQGERYEYEMNMLVTAIKNRVRIMEEAITTVYLENNRSSHFNPLIDSMKIYFLLIRFSCSSLMATSIDFVLFTTIYMLDHDILTAMVLARLVSGGVNFSVNKSLVFHNRGGVSPLLIKYSILFVAIGVLSYLSIRTMAGFGINVIAAKILAESVLFLASFTIQRDFIFAGQLSAQEG